jgi:hypothetical protein
MMAQVDHDLTTVNCVDPPLRVIKNLGRHNLPGLDPPPRLDLQRTTVGAPTEAGTVVRNGGMVRRSAVAGLGLGGTSVQRLTPPVGGTVPWWHYSVPRVAPWWCGARRPCCVRCGTAVVPTSSATVPGGGFRLLLAATAGARRLRGDDGWLVSPARCERWGRQQ